MTRTLIVLISFLCFQASMAASFQKGKWQFLSNDLGSPDSDPSEFGHGAEKQVVSI